MMDDEERERYQEELERQKRAAKEAHEQSLAVREMLLDMCRKLARTGIDALEGMDPSDKARALILQERVEVNGDDWDLHVTVDIDDQDVVLTGRPTPSMVSGISEGGHIAGTVAAAFQFHIPISWAR
jgi:hypothetical protein